MHAKIEAGESDQNGKGDKISLDGRKSKDQEGKKGEDHHRMHAGKGVIDRLSEKGELAIAPVSPDAFKPIATAQVLGGRCWSAPVLANSRLFCRNAAGDVVCLDLSSK